MADPNRRRVVSCSCDDQFLPNLSIYWTTCNKRRPTCKSWLKQWHSNDRISKINTRTWVKIKKLANWLTTLSSINRTDRNFQRLHPSCCRSHCRHRTATMSGYIYETNQYRCLRTSYSRTGTRGSLNSTANNSPVLLERRKRVKIREEITG